jgi:hypothetical protein
MKNNLLGKTFLSSFYLYRFRKYVSSGFPIIIFCNTGVHYETPCITYFSKRVIFIIQRNSGMSFLPTKYLTIELLLFLVIVYPLNLHTESYTVKFICTMNASGTYQPKLKRKPGHRSISNQNRISDSIAAID